jgi:hypothetical protein
MFRNGTHVAPLVPNILLVPIPGTTR